MNPRRSRAVRTPTLAVLALVLVGVLSGCSDGDDASSKTPEEALKAMNISEPVDRVVAAALERFDPGIAIGDELGRTYLQLKYAQKGYAWADAACVVDAVVAAVGRGEFGSTPVGRLDHVLYDHPELEATMRSCASAESLTRLDAPKAPVSATATAPTALEHAAPDIDGAAVGAMGEAFIRIGADRIGLTSVETTCVVGAILGDRDAAAFADLAAGRDRVDVDNTASDIIHCLKGDRVRVVAPAAGEALIAAKKSAVVESDRVQAMLQAQADAAVRTSTTVAG